jgi:GT2 family glycosyltransferase
VEVVTADWVEELVSVAGQDGVGVVGPLMRYDDGRMSHAGTVLGLTSIAGHVFRLRRPTDWTHFGLPAWPRNYLATSGGCLAVSAERFDQIGGFDETLTAEGSEIAVGIRLHEAGYRNVYWPFAELLTTRSSDQIQNDDRLVDYCRPYLDSRDPYFNANLDWNNEQVGLGPL